MAESTAIYSHTRFCAGEIKTSSDRKGGCVVKLKRDTSNAESKLLTK